MVLLQKNTIWSNQTNRAWIFPRSPRHDHHRMLPREAHITKTARLHIIRFPSFRSLSVVFFFFTRSDVFLTKTCTFCKSLRHIFFTVGKSHLRHLLCMCVFLALALSRLKSERVLGTHECAFVPSVAGHYISFFLRIVRGLRKYFWYFWIRWVHFRYGVGRKRFVFGTFDKMNITLLSY